MASRRIEGSSTTLAAAVAFASIIQRPVWADAFEISVSTGFKMVKCPALHKAFKYDASAATYTSVEDTLRDASATTTIDLDTFDASPADYLYLGFARAVRGFAVNVVNTNDSAAVMAVHYLKDDGVWTAVSSLSDGSDDGGDTLKQDGLVTFTAPTDWGLEPEHSVNNVGSETYWLRISVNADLDSDVTISQVTGLYENANYAETDDEALRGYTFNTVLDGGIEIISQTGTPVASINWMCP